MPARGVAPALLERAPSRPWSRFHVHAHGHGRIPTARFHADPRARLRRDQRPAPQIPNQPRQANTLNLRYLPGRPGANPTHPNSNVQRLGGMGVRARRRLASRRGDGVDIAVGPCVQARLKAGLWACVGAPSAVQRRVHVDICQFHDRGIRDHVVDPDQTENYPQTARSGHPVGRDSAVFYRRVWLSGILTKTMQTSMVKFGLKYDSDLRIFYLWYEIIGSR